MTGILGEEVKFTEGIINSNSGLEDDPRWYQHTATIHSGNSGGPLFNNSGDLVGINNATINYKELRKREVEGININYAIKARYLIHLMEDMELTPPISTMSNLNMQSQYKQTRTFVYQVITTGAKKSRLLIKKQPLLIYLHVGKNLKHLLLITTHNTKKLKNIKFIIKN